MFENKNCNLLFNYYYHIWITWCLSAWWFAYIFRSPCQSCRFKLQGFSPSYGSTQLAQDSLSPRLNMPYCALYDGTAFTILGQSWTSQLWSSWQDRESSIRIRPSSTSPCSTLSFVQAPCHQIPVQVCPWGRNCKPSIAPLYQSQYLAGELWYLILRWFLLHLRLKVFCLSAHLFVPTFSYTCH